MTKARQLKKKGSLKKAKKRREQREQIFEDNRDFNEKDFLPDEDREQNEKDDDENGLDLGDFVALSSNKGAQSSVKKIEPDRTFPKKTVLKRLGKGKFESAYGSAKFQLVDSSKNLMDTAGPSEFLDFREQMFNRHKRVSSQQQLRSSRKQPTSGNKKHITL